MLLWNGENKNVEDIKIGDILIGNDGTPRNVLNLHNGVDKLYKIKQESRQEYVVNSEHLLSFKYTNKKKIYWQESIQTWIIKWFDKNTITVKSKKLKPTINRTKEEAYNRLKIFLNKLDNDNTLNISVKNYLNLPDKIKKLLYSYKIEKPVNWEYKKVDIDPYILGMWLGDGNKNGRVFTTIDQELIDYWEKWCISNNMVINLHNDGQNIHYGITGTKSGKNIFKSKLQKYGLLDNKHIPTDYIYNTKEVRLSVLAGLIDTDGSVEQKGITIRISQSYEHKEILFDAKFIADSLGFRTSLKNKKTTWYHKNVKKNGIALVLTISGHGIENIPTILQRKKCNPPKLLNTTWEKIQVEELEIGEYYGFEVDNNKLFVLPDFTVVHNCEFTGRTVIGPDPTLKMGQLGMPKEVAQILTIPEQVTNFNYDYLTKLVNDGKVNIVKKKDGERINIHHHIFNRGTRLNHGDIIIRKDEKTGEEFEFENNNGKEMLKHGDKLKRNGELIKNIKYPEKRIYHLNVGDICERQLQNGDIVLLNRQPTKQILHS